MGLETLVGGNSNGNMAGHIRDLRKFGLDIGGYYASRLHDYTSVIDIPRTTYQHSAGALERYVVKLWSPCATTRTRAVKTHTKLGLTMVKVLARDLLKVAARRGANINCQHFTPLLHSSKLLGNSKELLRERGELGAIKCTDRVLYGYLKEV